MYIALYAMKKDKRATYVNVPCSLIHEAKQVRYT